MRFRLKLQVTILPFIILPILLAGIIYSKVGRGMLMERKSEILQLRLDSVYRFAEAEYDYLNSLSLGSSSFFNKKSWESVEQFASQLQNTGDPLFIIKENESQLDLSGGSGFKKGNLEPFQEKNITYFYYYKKFTNWNMILISGTEERSIYAPIDNATRIFILFSLINIFISIIIVFIISNKITKPMEKLTLLAKEMANNNLSIRAQISSNDEIGILSENLNIMVERLEESKKGLEEKVNVRTKELRDSLMELQITQEQLVESEKMAALGNLVAGVAHEINTPVGICITATSFVIEETESIKQKYNSNSMTKLLFESYLNRIDDTSTLIFSNLSRAAGLIKSFKNIATDQTSEEKRNFKILEYTNDILKSLHYKFKRTNIEVVIKCKEEILMSSYPGAISQVFTNLLLNSLIHGFEHIDNGQIIIEIIKIDEYIKILYRDNGQGMIEKDLKKIFEPFFTTKRGSGGSGLGMNIVYNLVTQTLGGSIQCSSRVDKGINITILIPINIS
ncbi:HAMP domain-containing protein [Thiospirochaeta perfilievii]|uniref:histidine kinase n=1 Tax=Thiospirochaeta perfilievii TaxID=252967 RepID=A0A5C1QCT2_9SPIO|nr:ATP-binding protein [Thiospirochaeta perfilievii]QEN05923.1 HAMP domain-containing protein [Thiospirochaeta perfilievii]